MKSLTRKRRRKVHRQRMRNEDYAYGVFVRAMEMHCRCYLNVCDSVLVGGICDDVQEADDDDFAEEYL